MSDNVSDTKQDAFKDVLAELRSITFAMKVHDASMPEVYDRLCDVALRLETAYKREMSDVMTISKNALDCLFKLNQLIQSGKPKKEGGPK